MILNNINNAKLGTSQVRKIYMGSNPVWDQNFNPTADVTNWLNAITAARAANGGNNFVSPDQTIINALNAFISGLYVYNLRSKIFRLNLFCGGDWSSSFIPVIRDVGNSSWDYNGVKGTTAAQLLTGPFTSSMWSLTGGFDASAVNSSIFGRTTIGAYLDTGISSSNANFLSAMTNYDVHCACYVSTLGNKYGTVADLTEIGYYGPNSALMFLRANYKPYYADVFQSTAQRGTPGFYTYNGSASTDGTNALVYTQNNFSFDPRGFSVGVRTSSSYTAFYKNTAFTGTMYLPQAYQTPTQRFFNPNYNPVTYAGLTANSTVTIFCDSANNALGVAKNSTAYSDRAITMYSIGKGLTDNDIANYTNLIQTFNSAIGRTNY